MLRDTPWVNRKHFYSTRSHDMFALGLILEELARLMVFTSFVIKKAADLQLWVESGGIFRDHPNHIFREAVTVCVIFNLVIINLFRCYVVFPCRSDQMLLK